METKTCTKCGEEHPATTEFFYVHKMCAGGLNTECRACCMAKSNARYNAKRKEIRRQSREKYRARRIAAGLPLMGGVVTLTCDWCGKQFGRYESQVEGARHFCCKTHSTLWWSRGDVQKTRNEVVYDDAGYKHRLLCLYSEEELVILDPMRTTTNWGKRIQEHRAVMALHLGRTLQSEEHIHHINGDKTDNRIENLSLTSNADHRALHKRVTSDMARYRRENEILRAMLYQLTAPA